MGWWPFGKEKRDPSLLHKFRNAVAGGLEGVHGAKDEPGFSYAEKAVMLATRLFYEFRGSSENNDKREKNGKELAELLLWLTRVTGENQFECTMDRLISVMLEQGGMGNEDDIEDFKKFVRASRELIPQNRKNDLLYGTDKTPPFTGLAYNHEKN